jgi:hypothetical protein
MDSQSVPTAADSLDLLNALWLWERDYQRAYRHLNADELRRLWYVLNQLTAQCASAYQKATGHPPDAADTFVIHTRG